MSFHDELEKLGRRSGGHPVYELNVGDRKVWILYINAKNKRVGWYVREKDLKNEKGPFRTKTAAIEAIN